MIEQFLDYIRSNTLLQDKDRVLLTISGGVDSVVMCDLFRRAGIEFGVAHCNFGLRGQDSENDEHFVRGLSRRLGVPLYVKKFDTANYARDEKISIQMAARELRYQWFDEIIKENDYACYATAHHIDDQIETFFINLLRGTGIAGLGGIPARQGSCIRPILFARKEDIEEYRQKNSLDYRIDKSNNSTRYLRNKIRHVLIPALEDISPEFRTVFSKNFEKLGDAGTIFKREIHSKRSGLVRKNKDGSWSVFIDELINLHPLRLYLFEILSQFDFSQSDIQNIILLLDQDVSGKLFYSPTHKLLKDRDELIIHPIPDVPEKGVFYIEDEDAIITDPFELIIKREKLINTPDYSDDPYEAMFDLDRLEFPLVLRKWRTGDAFVPLGMSGMKKLSDYFIDEKFSLFEKESTWILLSGDQICWIIGHRIDDRYKITPETSQILRIHCTETRY